MLLLKLAFRNILRQRRRSFLTILSMALGFFMAAFTLSVVEGSYGNIIDIFTRDHTGHVQVHADDYLDRPTLYKQINKVDEVVSQIEQVAEVLAVSPRIYAPSLAYAGSKTAVASLVGIDPEREANTTTLAQKERQGEYLTGVPSGDGYDVVMIGAALAETLKINIGDELVLIGQGVDGSIANDVFVVGAIVGDKNSSERLKVFLSLDAARRYLSMGSSAHEIAILTDNPNAAEQLAVDISAELSNERLSVAPWQVVEEIFYNTMTADKQSNQVTTLIVMAMVAIGVLNAVLMSAFERTREYGLLRAIGTRPRQVFFMIVVETMVLGVIGCIIGFALALPVLLKLSVNGIPLPNTVDVGGMAFETLLTEISVSTLGLPVLLVLGTSLIVSLWPGLRSARVTPTQALRAV